MTDAKVRIFAAVEFHNLKLRPRHAVTVILIPFLFPHFVGQNGNFSGELETGIALLHSAQSRIGGEYRFLYERRGMLNECYLIAVVIYLN
jgi:hypothetical protein